jgi:hypothetical protein
MWYTPPGMPSGDLSDVPFFTDAQRRFYYTTFALADQPVFAPGRGRNYDGGAIVGTGMLESTTGQSLEAVMQAQLFAPLQMTRTQAHPQYTSELLPWLSAPRVLSHTGAPGSYVARGSSTDTVRWMVGGIESSIVDMARFAYASMYSPAAPAHLYSAAQREVLEHTVGQSDFSPAWRLTSSDPARGLELSHNGNDSSSYWANMRVWPGRRVAFVVATNAFTGGVAAGNAIESWMMANTATFSVPAGTDVIDTALTANGNATATATAGSVTAANVLDGQYRTAWQTGASGTHVLTLVPTHRGPFPTFHRVLLDEGGFASVTPAAGTSGGYGRGVFPIAQYEVRAYIPGSPFFEVIASGTSVGPRRILDVGVQPGIGRIEVVVTGAQAMTLNEVHLLN